jgi:hypothetical protein
VDSFFTRLVRGSDGDPDPGYAAMYFGLIGLGLANAVILTMGGWAIYRAASADAGGIIQNVGIAMGAAATGFATMLGAVGLFRWGDKRRSDEH